MIKHYQIFQKIYNGLKFYTSGSSGYVDVIDVAESLLQLLFSDDFVVFYVGI